MTALTDAIRDAVPSRVWSQGVKLVNSGSVRSESKSDQEVVLRIHIPGGAAAPTVVLYLQDVDWECDCAGGLDACAHIVAGALAWERGAVEKAAATSNQQYVRYELCLVDGGIRVERYLVRGEGEERLKTTLSAVTSGRTGNGNFAATRVDLTIDAFLGTQPRAILSAKRYTQLLKILAASDHVTIDNKSIRVSDAPYVPNAVVRDHGIGVAIDFSAPAGDVTIHGAGAVLQGDVLRPIGVPEIAGFRLERLPATEVYEPTHLVELLTERLPYLQANINVDITTTQLPDIEARSDSPRIELSLEDSKGSITALASLVYGDPPIARIVDDKLFPLGQVLPRRNARAERGLLQRLRNELNMVPGRKVEYVGQDAVGFVNRLQAWENAIITGKRDARRFDRALLPEFIIDDDVFDIAFHLESDGERRTASLDEVLAAWKTGHELVPLNEGGWAQLPVAWLDAYGEKVADLLAARDDKRKISTAALPDLARLCKELDQPVPNKLAKLRPLLDDFEGLQAAELPDDLEAELREYQEHGVNWLCFLRDAGLGAILADDMGLGKTLQTICALRGKSLVVCPTSVLTNWKNELQRFRPSLKVAIFHGAKRRLNKSADVVITSYALLRIDIDKLRSRKWDCVVLDESQAIKNPESQVAQAAFQLEAKFRVALSGTPVENRLDELWSQMHFANRGLLSGRRDFRDRYERRVEAGDADVAKRLRTRIRPFVLRRMKREVATELPPRTDIVVTCELDTQERTLYDSIRSAAHKDVVEKLGKKANVMAVLEALLRLRQACCHAGLVPGQEAQQSSKVIRLREMLEEAVAEGHKALVFSQWTSLLDLVERELDGHKLDYLRLDGSTRDRGKVVDKFQAENGQPILLASLKAGGTGLNLTAADHVFLLDPWWNPAAEDQAADRAHRIGQDKPVFVYKMVAHDTIEEKILALQDRKKALADAALANSDQAAGLTRDDLMELLR